MAAAREKFRELSGSAKRAIGASVLALALLVAAYWVRAADLFTSGEPYEKLIAVGGALLFIAVGMVAVRNIAAEAVTRADRRMTPAHTGAVRLAVTLGGYIVIAIIALNQLGVQLGQLLVGGALTGVIIGIAAQQSLGNVFAGLVLVTSRPFTVGDRLVVHSGALGGPHTGRVVEMGLVYLTLENEDGLIRLPNSAVLGSAVAPNHTVPRAADPDSTGAAAHSATHSAADGAGDGANHSAVDVAVDGAAADAAADRVGDTGR